MRRAFDGEAAGFGGGGVMQLGFYLLGGGGAIFLRSSLKFIPVSSF